MSLKCRSVYRHWGKIHTRWQDQDTFGHVNNVEYYSYVDSTVCAFLRGGDVLRAATMSPGAPRPFVVESACKYLQPVGFPATLDVGILVTSCGRSSCTYKAGLFKEGESDPAAIATFVHVWTDAETQRPTQIPEAVRTAYEGLIHEGSLEGI